MGPECSHCTSLRGAMGTPWDGERGGPGELLGEEGTSRGENKPNRVASSHLKGGLPRGWQASLSPFTSFF